MEGELTQKIKILQELMLKWDESLRDKNLENIRHYALKIEEIGKDVMKEVWHKVIPSEKLSDIIIRISENEK